MKRKCNRRNQIWPHFKTINLIDTNSRMKKMHVECLLSKQQLKISKHEIIKWMNIVLTNYKKLTKTQRQIQLGFGFIDPTLDETQTQLNLSLGFGNFFVVFLHYIHPYYYFVLR